MFLVMVFNDIFNNNSVILWRSVLLVEKTGVPGKDHRHVVCHWQTLSHNVVSSTPLHQHDSNQQLYHTITVMATTPLLSFDTDRVYKIYFVFVCLYKYYHWRSSYYWVDFTPYTSLNRPYFCACPKLGPAFSTSYALVLFCVQLRWELAVRFVDIGGIVKHHCLNEDLDILVILFSSTTYLFRDSVVIHDIYWPDSIVLYDMHLPDYVVLYDALMISSYTTYIDIILSSYTTYIDLTISSYATYIDLILSSYATYIYLILSFYTILLSILCRLINGI
jgi:hypothetical protein